MPSERSQADYIGSVQEIWDYNPALRRGNASQMSFEVPHTGDVDSDYLVVVGGI